MTEDLQSHRRVVALAARQHGNVTREQLLDLGLGAAAVTYWVRSGRLHRVHPGVYCLGRPATTALERAAAVLLACGPTAALSHSSALALWAITDRWPSRLDVTVTVDRRPAGIRVHLCRTLTPRDIRRRHGIRVTSPARTLLDCAPALSDPGLARAVNDARLANLVQPASLAELLARCPRHPGTLRLRPFAGSETGPTRSELEDAFLTFCQRFDLPRPRVNTRVNGYEVDAYFAAERLIVELDGWAFHRTRNSFERDRERDTEGLAAGLPTVRITHERIMRQAEREALRLREILGQRRRQPRV